MSPEIKPQSKLTKNQEIGTPANREKFRQLGIHRWEDSYFYFFRCGMRTKRKYGGFATRQSEF